MIEQSINVAGVRLNVLEGGDRQRPSLVLLHGMRDVAMSLAPIFEPLAANFHIVAPDLRGHGKSDASASYDMATMVDDLAAVIESFHLDEPVLWGHSLGGHLVTRFAATHPGSLGAAVVVEGLGPPGLVAGNDDTDEGQNTDHEQLRKLRKEIGKEMRKSLQARRPPRPLENIEFAAARLTNNNPRLDPAQALTLARHLTRKNANGWLEWSFDPKVQEVFLDVDVEQSKSFWQRMECPTLIVMGDRAHEYWARQGPTGGDGQFSDADLAARREAFKHGHWITIADAGHMIHYDKPVELTAATMKFLAGLHS